MSTSLFDSLTGTEINHSNELVTLEVDPFAETVAVDVDEVVGVEVDPTEAVTLDVPGAIPDIALEVSEETSVGVGNVVGVGVDSTGTPEVSVLGFEVTDLTSLTDPFTVNTFSVLANLFGLL